ncbi:MAG: glycosyltransferase [Methylocystis sp.]|nr:glycosyltransferase [Acidobacteriaceae bacterium]MCA3475574.1 glycosyltransferase [Rhodobacter sp.]MCA3586024.1 glycosyltransferase [Methylocystis sp.]MCA4910077.1 glycosyltransferase [Methylobacterium sp.]
MNLLRGLARNLPRPVRTSLHRLWLRLNTDTTGVERLRAYAEPQRPGLLTFCTTVWNTAPPFLDALAESLFAQQGGTEFEWLILDNGSQDAGTRRALARIAQHPCVRLHRVENNLGIIRGMRFCLERASGRYILPLDSDDVLSRDCARIFTTIIVENGFPALLYSDEDKLLDGRRVLTYLKPDWDPVLFLHSCYIAHLCAIDRSLALEYGVYTDPRVEGSHDWDSFTRFHLNGHVPVHVPEVVYSWRMHAGSTAQNIDSKSFIVDSQRAVLERFLSGHQPAGRYRIEKSPLFNDTPDWRIRRAPGDEPGLTTFLLTDDPSRPVPGIPSAGYPGHRVVPVALAGGVAALLEALGEAGGLAHLLWDGVALRDPDWAWEALALMELFPDTVMVGGRILDAQQRVTSAAALFGFGKGCDAPDRMRPINDPGYFAMLWKPHSTSAVSSQHAVFRAGFLRTLLDQPEAGSRMSLAYLGAWAGAAARRLGGRVVYSPFLHGQAEQDWNELVTARERAAFVLANADLMPERRYASAHFGSDPTAPQRAAPAAQRAAQHEALLQWARSSAHAGVAS